MQEVFLTLFQQLEEHIPDEDSRREVYSELVPLMYLSDRDLLLQLEYEDPIFSEACSDYHGEERDE